METFIGRIIYYPRMLGTHRMILHILLAGYEDFSGSRLLGRWGHRSV